MPKLTLWDEAKPKQAQDVARDFAEQAADVIDLKKVGELFLEWSKSDLKESSLLLVPREDSVIVRYRHGESCQGLEVSLRDLVLDWDDDAPDLAQVLRELADELEAKNEDEG